MSSRVFSSAPSAAPCLLLGPLPPRRWGPAVPLPRRECGLPAGRAGPPSSTPQVPASPAFSLQLGQRSPKRCVGHVQLPGQLADVDARVWRDGQFHDLLLQRCTHCRCKRLTGSIIARPLPRLARLPPGGTGSRVSQRGRPPGPQSTMSLRRYRVSGAASAYRVPTTSGSPSPQPSSTCRPRNPRRHTRSN